jgi:hypothetical protein
MKSAHDVTVEGDVAGFLRLCDEENAYLFGWPLDAKTFKTKVRKYAHDGYEAVLQHTLSHRTTQPANHRPGTRLSAADYTLGTIYHVHRMIYQDKQWIENAVIPKMAEAYSTFDIRYQDATWSAEEVFLPEAEAAKTPCWLIEGFRGSESAAQNTQQKMPYRPAGWDFNINVNHNLAAWGLLATGRLSLVEWMRLARGTILHVL